MIEPQNPEVIPLAGPEANLTGGWGQSNARVAAASTALAERLVPGTVAPSSPAFLPKTVHGSLQQLELNLWSMWSHFGRSQGGRLHETANALWFDTPLATLPYNTVLRFHATRSIDRHINMIFAHYAKREVPFAWIVHPSAEPADLGARLVARGLREAETCIGMHGKLCTLPVPDAHLPGIRIIEAADGRDTKHLIELIALRWKLPTSEQGLLGSVVSAFGIGTPESSVRVWLAMRGDQPLAKVVLHLAHGVAGLYGVATRPEARGLGLARLLTLQAFAAARKQGYSDGILHSTPMSRGLYERLGFRALGDFRIFAPPDGIEV